MDNIVKIQGVDHVELMKYIGQAGVVIEKNTDNIEGIRVRFSLSCIEVYDDNDRLVFLASKSSDKYDIEMTKDLSRLIGHQSNIF